MHLEGECVVDAEYELTTVYLMVCPGASCPSKEAVQKPGGFIGVKLCIPCVSILHLMDDAVFLRQTIAWNRRILPPKHFHPEVLLLCVRYLDGFVCGFRGIYREGPYSFPAPVLMPSKIIKGEGLTEAEVDACTKQVTFVSLGPSVVVLCLP